ncbi:MAG: hypothetical protein H6536_07510 [Bacteroidales bacterium]|nr:hypothetical protein [Bacteroidales bacterium]
MSKLYTFSFFIILALNTLASTDTLTVMHYNLMYYDKEYEGCTSITNNVDSKDGYLRTIVGYIKPDIFTVNEINPVSASTERIKTNVLNINGTTKYKRANTSGDFLANMIYYNANKLVLKSQTEINTSPRITDVYKLYLKTNSLTNGDTIFLTCLVTHLKAGTGSESERTTAANMIMTYIVDNNITGNILLMGDMNLYSASEGAFTAFTSETGNKGFRFFDPINKIGDWNNNSTFKTVHTQSTHTESNGCFSTGGMDDRFDFILSSSDILNGTNGLVYKKYRAIGQDGIRFNESITYPENSSIPAELANALYNMSDHLPVEMKLTYTGGIANVNTTTETRRIFYNNPAPESLKIQILEGGAHIKQVNIYTVIGQMLYSNRFGKSTYEVEIPTGGFNPGIMIVELTLTDGYKKTFKVIR